MSDLLDGIRLDAERELYIGTLSREAIEENEATHLGFDGYFLFRASDVPGSHDIDILGKFPSYEAAFILIGIFGTCLKLGRTITICEPSL